ncbi:MAG TPA: cyclic nucleotide-binding domain-containing protein [Xanthomonadales bacterium]|nr:cyclic nucleotide-binding domain-containing protein [Xanthomonadales bacterium]
MNMIELFRDWNDVVEYPAKTVIFAERDPADVMYVILSGEVELTLRGEPLGAEAEGGMIGEMAMINSATRSATATTLSKVRLARVGRDEFKRLVSGNTEFSLHVMAVLANRLRALDNFITIQFARR